MNVSLFIGYLKGVCKRGIQLKISQWQSPTLVAHCRREVKELDIFFNRSMSKSKKGDAVNVHVHLAKNTNSNKMS